MLFVLPNGKKDKNVFMNPAIKAKNNKLNKGFSIGREEDFEKSKPMNKPKIYIAGKVTGLEPKKAALRFSTAASYLRGYGFLPINPIELVNDYSCPWQKAMRICIAEMMKADAVYMMDGWRNSQGAMLEYTLAQEIGIPSFEDYQELAKHFGQLPRHLCSHPDTYIKTIAATVGCETTVQACRWCGAELSEPKTNC